MECAKYVPAKRSPIGTNDVLLQQQSRIRTKLTSARRILLNHRPKVSLISFFSCSGSFTLPADDATSLA
jgi:hypothetical protein